MFWGSFRIDWQVKCPIKRVTRQREILERHLGGIREERGEIEISQRREKEIEKQDL